ncbi:hypothetical protein FLAG1_11685 [Fusarium langsethiae]|uniref:CSC1/OSCA1-like N-terminal transmembrane domain-containing protein n=1 Tax=Fusarium langsethiae TaxID=179993 RepID=A0A0N0DAR9_FUSLA|nr:hypothetical protein FLAG1_11685 [Fusarium langsethiae]
MSLFGMISTLAPVLITSMIYVATFLVLRKSNRRFYAPRTYSGTLLEHERVPVLPDGLISWIRAFWELPDAYALRQQSLDSYLFIRFLRICCALCFATLCITWPILLPLNITGGNEKKQLEILSYSNINIDDPAKKARLYIHCFVAWVVYSLVIYTIGRECFFYIMPKEHLKKGRFRRLFAGVINTTGIACDTKDLDRIVQKRDDAAAKLERAEVQWVTACNKEWIRCGGDTGPGVERSGGVTCDAETGELPTGWIPNTERPTHRVGFLGVTGQKVDTIENRRKELKVLILEARRAQDDWFHGKHKKHSAVFVEFSTQYHAQLAFHGIIPCHALQIAPRFIGVKPEEVIWQALHYPWWQVTIRRYATYVVITGLTVFWAVPVTILGILSQVNVIKTLPGLVWVRNTPQVILGILSGLLPSIALSLLVSTVPESDPGLQRTFIFDTHGIQLLHFILHGPGTHDRHERIDKGGRVHYI